MSLEIASQQANAPAETEGSAPPQNTFDPNAVDQKDSAPFTPEPQPPETPESKGSEPAGKSDRLEVSRETIEDLKAQRRKRQDAEREAAYWRGVAEARGQQAPTSPPDTPVKLVAPQPENFSTYAEYEAAKEEYILLKAEERAMQRLQQQTAYQREMALTEEFKTRLTAAAELDPDILEISEDRTLPINTSMAQVIKSSEYAPQILRHLNDNRKLARELYDADPATSAYRLGKLESTIAAKEKAPTTPATRKVSAAPPPIPTVGARGTPSIDEEKMPVDDWIAQRNAKQFRRKPKG
jgi:hypothetical protein